MDAVCTALQQIAGVEVHGHSATGNLVVTIEAQQPEHFHTSLAAIEALPSVLAVSLVYHEELIEE